MKKYFISKKLISAALTATMLAGTAAATALTAGAVDISIGNINTSINLDIPVNGSVKTLELDRTYDLPALVSGLTGNSYKVTLSNNRVLKYQNGKLKATGIGDVTLTLTLKNGVTLSKTFRVQKPAAEITFSNTKLSMIKGQSKTLTAILKNSKARVNWSSSNSKVVSVDQNGRLKAVNAGTAVITATTSNGKKASCTVTVGNPVTKVTLKHTAVKMLPGQKYQLSATVSPSNATNKNLSYKSSDSSIAAVTSKGLITAKKAGTCKITVSSSNGKTAVCTVTVRKK